MNWKKTELKKLDKQVRNAQGEEKRVKMSEQVMSTIGTPATNEKAKITLGSQVATLKAVFNQFSAGAKEIDGKIFAKLAIDCKIVNKKCTKTDIDLIFAKVKEKSARKITFP